MRWTHLAAVVLLAAALLALRADVAAVDRYETRIDSELPARIYTPARTEAGASAPVVVLLHGLGGDTSSLDTLARRLARGGYAVVAPQLRGHEANPRPLGARTAARVAHAWQPEVEAAVLFARSSRGFDPERVVVAGYGSGATAALEYASFDPSVAAVVAISGAAPQLGPYPPPNVLGLWASGDASALREEIRRMGAERAGLRQLVVDRVYGDIERGTAIKLTEVSGTFPVNVLLVEETSQRIQDWLGRSVRLPLPPSPSGLSGADLSPSGATAAMRSSERPVVSAAAGPSGLGSRAGWSLVALLALAWLVRGVARAAAARVAVTFVAGETTAGTAAPGPRTLIDLALALVIAILVTALTSASTGTASAVAFLPLLGARDLVGALFIAGGSVLALWRLTPAGATRETLGWSRDETLAALALLLPIYAVGGALIEPWTTTSLPAHRGLAAVGAMLLLLPLFVALESWVRVGGRLRAGLQATAARLVIVAALGVACALGAFEAPSGGLLLRAATILVACELLAHAVEGVGRRPWMLALLQAAWLGWMFGAVAPITAI